MLVQRQGARQVEVAGERGDLGSGEEQLHRGQLGAVETVPTILMLLNDEDTFTRSQAALVLGDLGGHTAVTPLIQTLENDPFAIARQMAANSLGEIGNERAVRPLIKSLEDRNDLVRVASLVALNRITGAELEADRESWMDWWNDKRPANTAE